MTPEEMESVIGYLVDKLDPASKAEVSELLGGNMPDIATDAMARGGIAWDRLPSRLRARAVMGRQHVDATVRPKVVPYDAAAFPNASRLK